MKLMHVKRGAAALALALIGAGCASTATPAADGPRIGVQLWSVRDEIKRDFDGTLIRLAQLGFEGVEFAGALGPYSENPAGLRALLDKQGLRCISAHVSFAQLEGTDFDTTTRYYKTLGCSALVIGWDTRAYALETVPQVAAELSALAARLAAVGLRIGYHNHAKEMLGADGKTPWDVLATGTPDSVILQQDVGWTTFAGKDPVAVVQRYPGRTVSMHYKAMFPPGTTGTPIIGQDRTDWAGVTAAARRAGGTQWLIVEHEQAVEGMGQVETVAASLRGLQAVLAKAAAN